MTCYPITGKTMHPSRSSKYCKRNKYTTKKYSFFISSKQHLKSTSEQRQQNQFKSWYSKKLALQSYSYLYSRANNYIYVKIWQNSPDNKTNYLQELEMLPVWWNFINVYPSNHPETTLQQGWKRHLMLGCVSFKGKQDTISQGPMCV